MSERWLDSEIPDELRGMLRSADLDEPSAAQLGRLRSRLGVTLGPAFTSPPPAPRAAAGSSQPFQLFSLGKSIGLASVIALGFGAMWYGSRPSPRAPSPPPSAASAAPLALARHEPAALPAPAPEPAPVAEPAPPPTAAAPAASDRRPHRERAPSPRAPGLGEELRQLESIRGWLAQSPQRALLAADEHERRFAHGALGPERELLRIDALLRLGQYERARQRGERVLAAPEAQPYRAQVANLLSGYRGAAAAAATIKPTRDE